MGNVMGERRSRAEWGRQGMEWGMIGGDKREHGKRREEMR